MEAIKPTYIPKNPNLPPKKAMTLVAPLSLLEKLERFGRSLHPSLSGPQVLKMFILPSLEDWLDGWLEHNPPTPGKPVPIENVRIFPLILRERKKDA